MHVRTYIQVDVMIDTFVLAMNCTFDEETSCNWNEKTSSALFYWVVVTHVGVSGLRYLPRNATGQGCKTTNSSSSASYSVHSNAMIQSRNHETLRLSACV